MNAFGGGAWPAGSGPVPAQQQQQFLNNAFEPPPYPGAGFNGQVQTAPYPVPNKWADTIDTIGKGDAYAYSAVATSRTQFLLNVH